MTIEQAISGLERLKKNISEAGEAIMKGEIPKQTGALADSVHSEIGVNTVTIIAGNNDITYARAVNDGRGEVTPVRKKALHWVEWHGPYAELPGGGDVFSMRSSPTKPNDYAERTARRLSNMKFEL